MSNPPERIWLAIEVGSNNIVMAHKRDPGKIPGFYSVEYACVYIPPIELEERTIEHHISRLQSSIRHLQGNIENHEKEMDEAILYRDDFKRELEVLERGTK